MIAPRIFTRRRRLSFENLESRRLLAAEGDLFSISRSLDSLSLAGNYSASIDWGDGKTSPGAIETGQPANKIKVRVDYSFDTGNFFTAPRRALLQATLDSVVGLFTDSLTAIRSSGQNTWTASFLDPNRAGNATVSRQNLQIAENELLVFVGAHAMASPQLGRAGPGGFSAVGTQAFLDTVSGRGQANSTGASANDFGPWGGSIAFNSSADFYFGVQPPQGSQQVDFVTTAVHELMHLLGFGLSASWNRLVSGNSFRGSNSVAAHDGVGNVPLTPGGGHWQLDLQDDGRETLMDPNQTRGERKIPTPLDIAALKDIGWQVPSTNARVTGNHVYADNGTFPVRVTLTGSRLGSVQQSFNTSITNVAPTLTVAADATAVVGQRLSIINIGQISDPGFRNNSDSPATDETFTYVIDWADDDQDDTGTATIDQVGNADRPTLGSFNGSHTFQQPGTYTVRVTVRDDDGGTATRSFKIVVAPEPTLSLSVSRTTVVEDGSTGAQLTIARTGGGLSRALTVNLSSSDRSELIVPATVTIAVNQMAVTLPLQIVDDTLLDGDQNVVITAAAAGIEQASVSVVVKDAESLQATVLTPSVSESAGTGAIRVRVARSNTDTSLPLEVSVRDIAATLATPVTSIVIPANRADAVLTLNVLDDQIPELTQRLDMRFTASGYAQATAMVSIRDDEPPLYQNPVNAFDVNGDNRVQPIDALIVINYLNRQGGTQLLDPADQLDIPFVDVSGNYQADPIDALKIINAINRGTA